MEITPDWLDKLSKFGLATLLIFVLWGGWKRVWVWGYQYEEERARTEAADARCKRLEENLDKRAAQLDRALLLMEQRHQRHRRSDYEGEP